ncbi:MAG: VOC family protein [Thermoplasmata archaeon]|nr:VOC family protein [Thermoplasmata archaeon]
MAGAAGLGAPIGPLRSSRIETILIFTRDFDRMLQFYRDTLGLTVGYSSPNFAELSAGSGAGIALHRDGATGTSPDGDVMIEFLVEDLATTVGMLTANGVSTDPIRSESFGKISGFRDPEGHRIGLEEPRRRSA